MENFLKLSNFLIKKFKLLKAVLNYHLFFFYFYNLPYRQQKNKKNPYQIL
jgi:hypothetical protein